MIPAMAIPVYACFMHGYVYQCMHD